MARQEMIMARCDRKECNTLIEVERSTEAPEGWLQIMVEVEGKYDPRAKLEFCSEKCVAIWAKNRRRVTHPGNGNGNGTREQMIAVISLMENEFEYTDIMELMDDPPSNGAIGQMLNAFAKEGIIKIVKQGGAGIRSRYVKA